MDNQWYVAIGSMSGPGVANAQLVSLDDYIEYEENGWDLRGPFSDREASEYIDRINGNNRKWNYYNNV